MIYLEGGKYLGSNKRSWNADGIIISETVYQTKVFEGWHAHGNNHISLIVSGGNREQRKGKEIAATPGEVQFYAEGELHRNFNTVHPSKNINVEISPGFAKRYNLPKVDVVASPFQKAKAKVAILKAYHECLTTDAQSQDTIHTLMLQLLDVNQKEIKSFPSWLKLLTEIIHDRLAESISLDELSRLINVHPVTISRYFSKYFCCTFGEYIRKMRVAKASKLILNNTHATLTEVGFQSGFYDQSHFIKTFKQFTGFSPKNYRKLNQG